MEELNTNNNIESFNENKLKYKLHCSKFKLNNGIKKISPYIYYFKNHNKDKIKQDYYKQYILFDLPIKNFDIDLFFKRYCKSTSDKINYFIDLDYNYCLFYSINNLDILKEIIAIEMLIDILQINLPYEIYNINDIIINPKYHFQIPFNKENIGICIRITPHYNIIRSNTKSASKR